MADEKRRINLGFRSGQAVALKLEQPEFDDLLKAIASEQGWHTIKDDDREIVIRADRVDFYTVDNSGPEQRVGF